MAHAIAQHLSCSEQASSKIPLLRRPRPPLKQFIEPVKDFVKTEEENSKANQPSRHSLAHTTPLTSSTLINSPEVISVKDYPLFHALYPRGPDLLPPGKVIKTNSRAPPLARRQVAGDVDLFTFDGLQQAPESVLFPKQNGYKTLSRENYLKITSWFAANVPKQEFINTVNLEADLQALSSRKPQQQMMLELQSMLYQMTSSNVSTSTISSEREGLLQWPPPTEHDIVFRSSTSRYFCGEGRSSSPFDAQHQPLISPAEAAILDCIMQGGGKLTLKAHFISKMPELWPVSCTLTFLNISYNDFHAFPLEILQLSMLVCLRMRCNPIRSIPDDIKKLNKLEIFCASFNLLTDLPSGMFELESLAVLDVSHNSIKVLSGDISKLRNLKKLDLSANQLTHLPPSFLLLSLTHLELSNNYLHPLFWTETTLPHPQSLSEMCCVLVSKCCRTTGSGGLPNPIRDVLQRHQHCTTCDYCGGSLFGEGIRVMRSVTEFLGTRNLPILFSVCSLYCKKYLKQKPLSCWCNQ